ncbi:hypothetical protein DB41_GM00030 [Neochlamydia sp. TUME1]|uniref:pentapeptide repeat-containing protein n=1 Tax=Neochlamydia sp. TUME1 TaxID=1478174 RepID=UPI000583DA3A|nr:pentapeptide repeat-containing protein [Neochlamydia sp. TUME1]KIC76125.1 hypothetical protein DB41_GM00030 [Neochlamydia sp. TUME1]
MCISSNKAHNIYPALNSESQGSYHFIFPLFKEIAESEHPRIKLGPYAEISSKIFAKLGVKDQGQAKLVCREWRQLIQEKDDEFTQQISNNGQLMNSHRVHLFAADYLQQASELLEIQYKLLKIVKSSKDCSKLSVAAANAMMILKKTGFSFVDQKLERIQIPHIRLSHAIFDGADLSKANLSYAKLRDCSLAKANLSEVNLSHAELKDCSLRKAILDGANLENIEFGHRPYLQHSHPVLAAALSPDGRYLVSNDAEKLYVWDLITFRKMSSPIPEWEVNKPKQRTSLGSSPSPSISRIFLLFSQDGKFLFRAYGQGKIEIWETKSLKIVEGGQLKLENMNSFSLFTLIKDGLILSGTRLKSRCTNIEADQKAICLWKIDLNKEDFPQFKRVKDILIKDNKMGREGLVEERGNDIIFSQEKSLLAVKIYQSKCIKFYSFPTLELLKDKTIYLEGKIDNISNIQFTPKGDLLLIVKGEKGEEVCAWDSKNKEIIPLFSEKSGISNLQFLSNSSLIAYFLGTDMLCMRDSAKNYQLMVREQFSTQKSRMANITFLLTNKRLLRISNEKIFIRTLESFYSKKETPLNARLRALRFSSNDEAIYLLNSNGRLYEYESSSGMRLFYRAISTPEHALPISKQDPDVCALSAHAHYILGIQRQQKMACITLSQAKNEKERDTFRMNDLLGCALSEDNCHLVSAHQNQFEIWDIASKIRKATVSISSLSGKKIGFVLSPSVFPIATLITIEHELRSEQTKIWKIDWRTPQVQLAKKFSSITNIRFLDDSRLIFQESCSTISIWESNADKANKIDFNNRVQSFDLSLDGSLMIIAEKIIESPQAYSYRSITKLSLWNMEQKKRLLRRPCLFLPQRFAFRLMVSLWSAGVII